MTPIYRRIPVGTRHKYVESGVHPADVFGIGAHLVVVKPGLTSTLYQIDPDHAGLLAAMRDSREAMAAAMVARCEPRPSFNQARHERAWAAYLAAGGDSRVVLTIPSAMDVVEAGLAVLLSTKDAG